MAHYCVNNDESELPFPHSQPHTNINHSDKYGIHVTLSTNERSFLHIETLNLLNKGPYLCKRRQSNKEFLHTTGPFAHTCIHKCMFHNPDKMQSDINKEVTFNVLDCTKYLTLLQSYYI